MRFALCGPFQLRRQRRREAYASRKKVSIVEAVLAAPGAQDFCFDVPEHAASGSSIRVKTPDDRVIELVLPSGCKPGQRVTMAIGRSGGKLQQMQGEMKANYEASQARCASLRQTLVDELQKQRVSWEFDGDLSHEQVLVFAAAESEDTKQLAGALSEAGKSGSVSRSLKDCCRSLNAAEEAVVIWRCLLDALISESRTEILFWMDEARNLRLELPNGLADALNEVERGATRDDAPHHQDSQSYIERNRSVRELYEECKLLGIDTRGCAGKEDLLELIRNAPKPQRTAPQGFVTQVPAARARTQRASDADTVWSRDGTRKQFQSMRAQHLWLIGMDPARVSVSQQELRAAYRKTAMECHPDRQHNHDRQDEAKALFQKVRVAFDYLNAEI